MESTLQQTNLGKYRLIASLARGGMARVYLALMAGPADFHKLLVLKVLREGMLAGAEDGVNMFLNEARLAARLVHPNLIHTYEVGEVEGRYYLAMEYVEGQTYRALTFRSGPDGLPLADHLRILSEVARGLHHLHEQTDFDDRPLGAVHRDVSPQNILIGYDGQVKLLDFGIAKTTDASHWTRISAIKGKIDYIAPEQLCGEPVDRRTDVFALGVLLYEALSGCRFAGGTSVTEVAKAHARLTGAEPSLRAIAHHRPEALIAIAEKALALDPAQRFPDAASFGAALDAYAAEAGERATATTLSAQLCTLFAEDRQKLRLLVEQQVENARHDRFVELGSTATGELPRVGSRTAPPALAWQEGMEREPSPDLTRAQPEGSKSTGSRARSWTIVALSMALAATVALQSGPQTLLAPAPTAPEGPSPAPAARPPTLLPSVSASENTVTVAPLAPSVSREPSIHAELTVSPAHASVRLDGVPLTLPFSGELPRDGRLHALEASAPAHQTVHQLVGFDRDRTIHLSLSPIVDDEPRPRRQRERERTRERRRASSAPAAAAEPAPEAVEEAAPASLEAPAVEAAAEPGDDLPARTRSPREIDTSDPYEEEEPTR